jgi:hypothetical protein
VSDTVLPLEFENPQLNVTVATTPSIVIAQNSFGKSVSGTIVFNRNGTNIIIEDLVAKQKVIRKIKIRTAPRGQRSF